MEAAGYTRSWEWVWELVDSLEVMLAVLARVLLPLCLTLLLASELLASERGWKGGEGGRWSDDVAHHPSCVVRKRV